MARRKRSYRSKNRSVIGTFINNSLVDKEKRVREQKKYDEAESKAREKDELRMEKFRAKEMEKHERQKEKQNRVEEARKLKETEAVKKLSVKVEKIYVRLEKDVQKMGLYPSKKFLDSTSKEAEKLSVSPSAAKSYFIDEDNINKVAKLCAKDFLESKNYGSDCYQYKAYDELLKIVTDFRPQEDASQDIQYRNIKKELDNEIRKDNQKFSRQNEREKLIEKLTKSKQMFNSDLYDFWEKIEDNDWGHKEAVDWEEYEIRIKAKKDYVAVIKSQIKPIKLQKSF